MEICEVCDQLWKRPSYKCNLEFCLIYEYAMKKTCCNDELRLRLQFIKQQICNCKISGNQMEIDYAINFSKEELCQKNVDEAKKYLEKAMKLCGVIIKSDNDDKEIIENATKISLQLLDKVDQSNYEIYFDNYAKMLTLHGRIAYEDKDFKSALVYFVSANHTWWEKSYNRRNKWRNSNTLFILESLIANKASKVDLKKMLGCILRNKYFNFDAEYREDITMKTNYKISLSNKLLAILIYFSNKIHDFAIKQLSSF